MEWKDHSGLLTVWLSDDVNDFDAFAHKMTSWFGAPTARLDAHDQRYWDFSLNQTSIVLHGDTMVGLTIHVEDGSQDDLLRSIARGLLTAKT